MAAGLKPARLKVNDSLMNMQQSLSHLTVAQHLRGTGFAEMGNNLLFHGLAGGQIYLLFWALVVLASL